MTVTPNESTPRSCKVRSSYWTNESHNMMSPITPTKTPHFSRKLSFNSTEDEVPNQKKRHKTSKIPVGSSYRSKSCERTGQHRVNTQRVSIGADTNNIVLITPTVTPRTPLSILNNPTSASACKVRDLRKRRVIRSKSSDNLAQCFVSMTPVSSKVPVSSSKVPANRIVADKKRRKKNLTQKFKKAVMKPDVDGNSLHEHSFVDWFRKRLSDSWAIWGWKTSIVFISLCVLY